MKMKKMKDFVKNHKREILIGTVMVVGSVVVCAITKRKPRFSNDTGVCPIVVSNWTIGKMSDIWTEGGHINAIVNDINANDLGEFGKELLKIDGFTNDSLVDVIIGIADNR